MDDGRPTEVTFEFDGPADQVYLCLQPRGEGTRPGAGGWETRQLEQVAPGAWAVSLRLAAGWWRFRYYTAERGCFFYAPPTDSVLLMDGLDAMLHVTHARNSGHNQRRRSANLEQARDVASGRQDDQFLCVLSEEFDVDPTQNRASEEAAFSSPTSPAGAARLAAEVAPDRRRAGWRFRATPCFWAGETLERRCPQWHAIRATVAETGTAAAIH